MIHREVDCCVLRVCSVCSGVGFVYTNSAANEERIVDTEEDETFWTVQHLIWCILLLLLVCSIHRHTQKYTSIKCCMHIYMIGSFFSSFIMLHILFVCMLPFQFQYNLNGNQEGLSTSLVASSWLYDANKRNSKKKKKQMQQNSFIQSGSFP